MKREEWTDRLVDSFLQEAVAGERPSDQTRQILARAASRGRRRVRAWAPLAAAAAVLVVTAGVWTWWPQKVRQPPVYPPPAASGAYTVEGDAQVRRGAVIETHEGEARLLLGGYARITMRPGSTAVIAGRENAEEIFLTRGEVECEVEGRKDRLFSVQTELGTVSVVGTRFTVQLTGEENDMNARTVMVKVIVGTVMVTSLGASPSVLHAGERGVWGRRRPGLDTERPAFQDAKTPLEKARAACLLQERALKAQRQQIEDEVLQDAEVAAAMKASQAAARAPHTGPHDHPDYGDLKQAREAVAAEFQKLTARLRRGRREDWQKSRQEFGKLRTRSAELRGKMLKLAEAVPELAELKKKTQDALIAFLTKYQEKLNANKKYADLGKQLEEIAEWAREIDDQMTEERRTRRDADR